MQTLNQRYIQLVFDYQIRGFRDPMYVVVSDVDDNLYMVEVHCKESKATGLFLQEVSTLSDPYLDIVCLGVEFDYEHNHLLFRHSVKFLSGNLPSLPTEVHE